VDCRNLTRTSRANHPGLDEPLRLKRRTGAIRRPSLIPARTAVGDRIRTALVRSAQQAERWTPAAHWARLNPSHDAVDLSRNEISVPSSIPPTGRDPGGPGRVQRDRTSTRKPIKGEVRAATGPIVRLSVPLRIRRPQVRVLPSAPQNAPFCRTFVLPFSADIPLVPPSVPPSGRRSVFQRRRRTPPGIRRSTRNRFSWQFLGRRLRSLSRRAPSYRPCSYPARD
jgi:hypothetical protein